MRPDRDPDARPLESAGLRGPSAKDRTSHANSSLDRGDLRNPGGDRRVPCYRDPSEEVSAERGASDHQDRSPELLRDLPQRRNSGRDRSVVEPRVLPRVRFGDAETTELERRRHRSGAGNVPHDVRPTQPPGNADGLQRRADEAPLLDFAYHQHAGGHGNTFASSRRILTSF